MKKGNSIWLNIVYILLGALISFFLCQFEYLEIDPKVNIATTIVSTMTVFIGLYLAISLKKVQNKSSNLHGYLQPKLDITWQLFLILSHELSLNDQMELSKVTKSIKEICQKMTPLKKMFSSFGLTDPCLGKLETMIEDLEKLLVDDCDIAQNVINYSNRKAEVKDMIDNIHTMFAYSLKEINKVS